MRGTDMVSPCIWVILMEDEERSSEDDRRIWLNIHNKK